MGVNQFSDPSMLVENHYSSEKWARFSEILGDFNPDLELRWIPPEHRTDPKDSLRPYAIVHSRAGQKEYVVMFATELDDPQEILARLFAGDVHRNKSFLEMLDAQNAAVEAFRLKEQMAQREVEADFAHFLMTNRSKWFIKTDHPVTGEKLRLDHNGRRRD